MFWRKKKAIIKKYPEPMKPQEVRKVILQQGKDSKLWQALDAVIDTLLLDAVNDVADQKNDITKFAHAAGRVDALSVLKSTLEEHKTWKSGKTRYKNS